MIVALDVHYFADDSARAAAAGFHAWSDAAPAEQTAVDIEQVAPYVPGKFYLREFPCLELVLTRIEAETVAVDAYVDLAPGRPGLGRHLFESLDARVPVIGVAKTHFAGSNSVALLRGRSKTPLHVTAAGVSTQEAARAIASMHGPYRIPTLLKRVDALARGR